MLIPAESIVCSFLIGFHVQTCEIPNPNCRTFFWGVSVSQPNLRLFWVEKSPSWHILARQNAALLKQSDVDGSTPLHLCAKQGHAECVQLLLQSFGFNIGWVLHSENLHVKTIDFELGSMMGTGTPKKVGIYHDIS